jgi:hypothetical protein
MPMPRMNLEATSMGKLVARAWATAPIVISRTSKPYILFLPSMSERRPNRRAEKAAP